MATGVAVVSFLKRVGEQMMLGKGDILVLYATVYSYHYRKYDQAYELGNMQGCRLINVDAVASPTISSQKRALLSKLCQ